MSVGLAALLDDIAAIAKAAAASVDDVAAAAGKASLKASGIVVDDTAVTPRYVTGLTPDRELPIIWKITKGSLRNKLLIILPVIMVLSQFAPWLLTPILMLGGAYLSFEGAHKIWGAITGHGAHDDDHAAAEVGPDAEKRLVDGAVRTDLILSAEIMVISLYEVAQETFWMRLAVLIVVALAITVLVYGFVGLLVKIDDIGLGMTKRRPSSKLGPLLVKAMPKVLSVISIVGIAAMLWVGGHILLDGADKLGWHEPMAFEHHAEEWVASVVPAAAAPVLSWLTATILSAIAGFLVGSLIVGVVALIPARRGRHERPDDEGSAAFAETAPASSSEAALEAERAAEGEALAEAETAAGDAEPRAPKHLKE
ncbi:Inner membrane protein YedI [Pseudoclavibacter triregionum]|nr:Inner membrane protein YedI [Pseudoclavibacter triregionum]